MAQETFRGRPDAAAKLGARTEGAGSSELSFGQRSLQRFMYVLVIFWLLNGLDKFFNYPKFFGKTRAGSFVEYFSRLDLPDWLALVVLDGIGWLEIILGISFFIGLFILRRTRKLTLINLEISLLAFLGFSIADIMFGDRKELWEHGTYTILIIISYLSTLFIAREVPGLRRD
jgi:uncharacterized membrane protein YphA (DoxX/SURF4 family)